LVVYNILINSSKVQNIITSSLKQQNEDRHFASFVHIILIP